MLDEGLGRLHFPSVEHVEPIPHPPVSSSLPSLLSFMLKTAQDHVPEQACSLAGTAHCLSGWATPDLSLGHLVLYCPHPNPISSLCC